MVVFAGVGRCYGFSVEADAVIVAAGSSARFGQDKLFAPLCGLPVLAWALVAFAEARRVREIVVVASSANLARVRELSELHLEARLTAVVEGGARRRDSVEAGLRAASGRYVAIHDGARPLVTPGLIDAVIASAEGVPGAIPVVPVTDTIKSVSGGRVTAHLDRTLLRAAQTPQVVGRHAWLDAASMSDGDETDDAAMIGRLSLDVAAVEGDPANLKITRLADLALAAAIIRGRGLGE